MMIKKSPRTQLLKSLEDDVPMLPGRHPTAPAPAPVAAAPVPAPMPTVAPPPPDVMAAPPPPAAAPKPRGQLAYDEEARKRLVAGARKF